MPWKDMEAKKAYNKAYYEKNKKNHYQKTKHNSLKWRSENRLRCNLIAKKSARKYKEKNRNKIRSYQRDLSKKRVNELTEIYLIKQLIKGGWTKEQIRLYPDLIQIKRLIIKMKRLK